MGSLVKPASVIEAAVGDRRRPRRVDAVSEQRRDRDREAYRSGSPSWVIRQWALVQGLWVAGSGRLPRSVMDAYRAEHPDGVAQ